MKFAGAEEIISKAATIKAYVREATAIEKAGLRVEKKKTEDFPVPEAPKRKFPRLCNRLDLSGTRRNMSKPVQRCKPISIRL